MNRIKNWIYHHISRHYHRKSIRIYLRLLRKLSNTKYDENHIEVGGTVRFNEKPPKSYIEFHAELERLRKERFKYLERSMYYAALQFSDFSREEIEETTDENL